MCLLLDDEVLSKRIPPSFFLSCNLDGGREGPRVRDRKNGKEKVNIDEEIRKAEEIKGVLPPPDNPPMSPCSPCRYIISELRDFG